MPFRRWRPLWCCGECLLNVLDFPDFGGQIASLSLEPVGMKQTSRRQFIKSSTAFAPFMIVPGYVVGQGDGESPNSKIRVAAIGAGGKGRSDIGPCGNEDVVALCDIDFNRAADSIKKFPKAKLFKDWRKMIADFGDNIDAVTVSTPDHMHYPASLAAINAGKHVYVQKPLTHTVWEARKLREAAAEAGVVTQMGNQGHAGDGCRRLKEWVQAGAIGSVKKVTVWTNRPVWPQNLERPGYKDEIPEDVNWDGFLGVAKKRPFTSKWREGKYKGKNVYHPFVWRGWYDFGCGALGDMACHIMDGAYYAMNLTAPDTVELLEVDGGTDETFPAGSVVRYTFPARGDMPAVELTWYEGTKRPPRPEGLDAERKMAKGGFLLHGSENTIYNTDDYCRAPRMIPETAFKEFMEDGQPPKTIARVPDQNPHNEWIRAIKGEGPIPGSNFEYSGPFTEVVNLGVVAQRVGLGKKIVWDSHNMKAVGLPEADQFINKEYRKEYLV